jgi:catechol 2,3-dioxygenase-like lactoylglutathione lyase family enzyme
MSLTPTPQNAVSSQTIAHISYLVADNDEAIAFVTQKLGFSLLEDADLASGIHSMAHLKDTNT